MKKQTIVTPLDLCFSVPYPEVTIAKCCQAHVFTPSLCTCLLLARLHYMQLCLFKSIVIQVYACTCTCAYRLEYGFIEPC